MIAARGGCQFVQNLLLVLPDWELCNFAPVMAAAAQ